MFEYTMSKTMADELLKARKGESRKMQPQEYLCKYVNEQFGLLYPVVGVHLD
jgi:hypothetical protein